MKLCQVEYYWRQAATDMGATQQQLELSNHTEILLWTSVQCVWHHVCMCLPPPPLKILKHLLELILQTMEQIFTAAFGPPPTTTMCMGPHLKMNCCGKAFNVMQNL